MIENFCKVKIIRNFLSLYKENCWEKLICNMAEYGIIILKKKKNISSMSSEDIINFVEDFKRTEGLLSPLNNIINHKINSRSKNKKSNKSFLDNSFNKSITSNYFAKSSKSSNKKRGFSVKAKTKSKQKFMKRNESFSFNKSAKKNKKLNNKLFSGLDNNRNNNNYMRIKIESNREYKNNNTNINQINYENHPLKESFVSMSSKDSFASNKKKATNNFKVNHKLNNSNNKKPIKQKSTKKNMNINNNNEINNNVQVNNTYNNTYNNNTNNIKKKKKKKNSGGNPKTVKVESKIKDLIKKDKSNFINTGGINSNNFNDLNNNQVYALPMNAMEELGSLRSNNDIPSKTSSDSLRLNIIGNKNNNNINNNIQNNELNNLDINNNLNNTNTNNNITTITSLEDKLNGLTLKLSKLNESINNNKKKLSAYSNMDQFSIYNNNNNNIDMKQEIKEKENNSPFINIGLGNTVLGNLNNINEIDNNNIKLNNGINNNIGLKHINFNINFDQNNFEDNKIINNNNNMNNENDEDYLGEEQINI